MKLVTPQLLARLESLKILSHRRLKAVYRGEQAGLRKGSSVEFSDYREYIQGDDIRNIDWNVYARAERYFLKLFLEEESKPVYFLIDCSESMNFGNPGKLKYSLALSVCLAYVSLRRYDKPGIFLLKSDQNRKIPVSSLKNYFLTLELLERERGEGETNLSSALRKFLIHKPAKGICFLLSDFFSSDGFDGIKLLPAAGHELHCLHVLSAEEEHPDLRGDLKLVDSESGDISEVSISPYIVKKYESRLEQFKNDVRAAAHQGGARYHSIDTGMPLDALLFGTLKKTAVLL